MFWAYFKPSASLFSEIYMFASCQYDVFCVFCMFSDRFVDFRMVPLSFKKNYIPVQERRIIPSFLVNFQTWVCHMYLPFFIILDALASACFRYADCEHFLSALGPSALALGESHFWYSKLYAIYSESTYTIAPNNHWNHVFGMIVKFVYFSVVNSNKF